LAPEGFAEIGDGAVRFEVASFAIFADFAHCTKDGLDNDCPNNLGS
jgi:hypothetical protein